MSATTNSPTMPSLAIYRLLGYLPWLRHSFKAKVLSIAFLGTHVPLLTILAYFIFSNAITQAYALKVLAMALVATLVGTLATLLALRVLLRPIDLTLNMLAQFQQGHLLQPRITLYDEMGQLIDGTERTLADLDAHLQHVATHDDATGALNTRGLERALREAMGYSPHGATLIQIRVRNFTQMQASLGRDEIEFVTRTIVDRLRLAFPKPCRVAVSGRGHFSVMAAGSATGAMPDERLSQTLEDLAASISVGATQDVAPLCVLGVAEADDSTSADNLFSAAETAVLAAEEQEGSGWIRASDADGEWRTRLELAFELDQAIRESQLFPVYQPRINIHSGEIESLEALVRWRHPERGIVSPGLFIPIAERTGRILDIGRYMLDQAVAQAAVWERAGQNVVVSVNVAAAQISDAALLDNVRDSLQRHGLSPQHLELEITETALLHSTTDSVAALQQIRDLGVAIALDDFGTGYSSLSHLSSLPTDRIKIDQSFVSRLDIARDRQIIEGVVALARALGMAVTAEGVETREQAEALRIIGCDEWQGFLFARPTTSEDIDWQPQATRTLAHAAGQ